MLPKILIVDDVSVNRKLLSRILVQEGFEVEVAENGVVARAIAKMFDPDLIFLDVMMPEEDGFVCCQKMKETASLSQIPIIFLTSMTDIDSKIKGFELGAVDYLTKPFERVEVLLRARLHIKLHRTMKKLFSLQKEKLEQISEAQKNLLPKLEEIPKAKFEAFFESNEEAGGDFFDVIEFNENLHLYASVDVSGHDLGASLATAIFKTALVQNSGPLYPLKETVTLINKVLIDVFEIHQYLTLSICLLNRKTKTLEVICGGSPSVLIQKENNEFERICPEGDIIGMFEPLLIHSQSIKVSEKDRIFMFSDGLLEHIDANWDKGTDYLDNILKSSSRLSLKESIHFVKTHFDSLEKKQDDDFLLLGIEV